MTKEEQNKIVIENYGRLNYKEISSLTGLSISSVKVRVYKFIPKEKRYRAGKSIFSYRIGRKNNLNDNYFSIPNLNNCYWAGFIAADGNIDSKFNNKIKIGLAIKDVDHLEKFKEEIKYEGKIFNYITKYKYNNKIDEKLGCVLAFTSEQIATDLNSNFNITPRKSLTLIPPNIIDKSLIDAYIIGILDGDGSIGLYKSKRQRALTIQVLGTYEVVNWIQDRFKEILKEDFNAIYKRREGEKNTYCLTVSDKRARKLFLHYYLIDVNKLSRKWSKEIYEYCINYKKFKNIEKYKDIHQLDKSGLTTQEIANKLGVTYQVIFWYKKQPEYKNFNMEESS